MNMNPVKKKKKFSPFKWIINILLIIGIILALCWWQYPNILHHIIEPMMHKETVKTSLSHQKDYDKNKKLLNGYVDQTGVNIDSQNYDGRNEKLENALSNLRNQQLKGKSKDNSLPDLTYDYGNVKPFNENDWKNISQKYDPRLLVGHIRIPAIDVNLPVLEGVSNVNLYRGAGTLKPYQQLGKGNYALASHHMPDEYSNFSRLAALQKGNKIYVSSSKYIYVYSVKSVENLPNDAGYVVNDVPGETLITLVTCSDIRATSRIVVQGTYKGKLPLKSNIGQKYFSY